MNNLYRTIFRCAIIYLVLTAAFAGLLIFCAALPHSRKFDSLMRRSARFLAKDGEWPASVDVTLDNYMDAKILNVAYSLESDHPVRSAMESTLYRENKEPSVSTRAFFLLTYGDREKLCRTQYARYWFGHSAVIKILHYLWDIHRIYVLYGGIVLLLAFLAAWHINRTHGFTGVFALFILLCLCD